MVDWHSQRLGGRNLCSFESKCLWPTARPRLERRLHAPGVVRQKCQGRRSRPAQQGGCEARVCTERRPRVEFGAVTQPPKAVVLLSGGLDSTTTLAIARSEGFEPHAMSFR